MDKYMKLLETWSGEFEDLCYELLSLLKEEKREDRIKYFQIICEEISEIDSDESVETDVHFEEGEIDDLKSLYGKYIDEVINSVRNKIICEKLAVSDFYSLLWDMVMDNPMLVSAKEKSFGLLWILADSGIPYYEIGKSLSMENEEYKEIIENNKLSINRLKYILSLPFEQKTEVASLILQELFVNKDFKVQAVLLSQVLDIHAQKEIVNFRKFLGVVKEEDKE